jgi:hypothetical protein
VAGATCAGAAFAGTADFFGTDFADAALAERPRAAEDTFDRAGGAALPVLLFWSRLAIASLR